MAGHALQYMSSTLRVIVFSAAKELFEKIKKLIVKNDKIGSHYFSHIYTFSIIIYLLNTQREKEQYRVLKIQLI